jgi:gliding motility-associated-like protein
MDSLVATLVSKTHPLNIGVDTTICAGTSIQLNASKDFLGYRWSTGSNGSTDSLLTVTQPGLYWVEVTDSCYNTIRDSILIQPFYFAMDIGPDRLKCKEDTIQLKAPSGFLNYQWSNNYNINALNTQNVVVNPTVDTAYYCKAEKLPGCFSFDTVRIRIYPKPVVALGNDISFCAGDSAQLNAGAGFAQYLWTGGSTQPMLTVRAVGSYSVVATTAQGCKATDTVDVVQVFTNPNVNLDANPYLCTGTTRTLQAGSFANYLWQDGSRLATYTVRQPGTYYVTVTDNNLCKGTDTVRIISFKPLPQNFLPADMAICNYGDNRLMANQSFTNYLWNTGETGSSLKISLPGTYWLRATDQFGCVGSDTINISIKECLQGLYVPTAFSPNSDGLNDVLNFRLFGNIQYFSCLLYNRYGQIIFSTSSPTRGWDGRYQGELQPAGAYVWVCNYQLVGEAKNVKTGSVLLVR